MLLVLRKLNVCLISCSIGSMTMRADIIMTCGLKEIYQVIAHLCKSGFFKLLIGDVYALKAMFFPVMHEEHISIAS